MNPNAIVAKRELGTRILIPTAQDIRDRIAKFGQQRIITFGNHQHWRVAKVNDDGTITIDHKDQKLVVSVDRLVKNFVLEPYCWTLLPDLHQAPVATADAFSFHESNYLLIDRVEGRRYFLDTNSRIQDGELIWLLRKERHASGKIKHIYQACPLSDLRIIGSKAAVRVK